MQYNMQLRLKNTVTGVRRTIARSREHSRHQASKRTKQKNLPYTACRYRYSSSTVRHRLLLISHHHHHTLKFDRVSLQLNLLHNSFQYQNFTYTLSNNPPTFYNNNEFPTSTSSIFIYDIGTFLCSKTIVILCYRNFLYNEKGCCDVRHGSYVS
jgi:hypothetical protein